MLTVKEARLELGKSRWARSVKAVNERRVSIKPSEPGVIRAEFTSSDQLLVAITEDASFCECGYWLAGELCQHVGAVLLVAAGSTPKKDSVSKRAPSPSPEELKPLVTAMRSSAMYLDYSGSRRYAHKHAIALNQLDILASKSTNENTVVPLIERSLKHHVKTIWTADDSAGTIGQNIRVLLMAHVQACHHAPVKPDALIKWLAGFAVDVSNYWTVDFNDYADLLEPADVDAYRVLLADRPPNGTGFGDGESSESAVKDALLGLAVYDRDPKKIVALITADWEERGSKYSISKEPNAHYYLEIAKNLQVAGFTELAEDWVKTGRSYQAFGHEKLVDFSCDLATERDDFAAVFVLRAEEFDRFPTSTNYSKLAHSASHLSPAEIDQHDWAHRLATAFEVMAQRDPNEAVGAALIAGNPDLAWEIAQTHADQIYSSWWNQLAFFRLSSGHAEDAATIYGQNALQWLAKADTRIYPRSVTLLEFSVRCANLADVSIREAALHDAAETIAFIRQVHGKRPTLMRLMDGAGLP